MAIPGHSSRYRPPARSSGHAGHSATWARNQRNPLYNPSKILSGNNLLTGARGLVDLQTKPALAQIARDIGQNDRQGTAVGQRTNQMYGQLAGVEKTGYADQQANA